MTTSDYTITRFLTGLWGENQGFIVYRNRVTDEWLERIHEPSAPLTVPQGPDVRLDTYFSVLPFEEGKPRQKPHAISQPHLWADLDKVDPRDVVPRPSIAWETSPGSYQAVWNLDYPLTIDNLEALNKRLTYHLGADKSGWDRTQLLRVPNSWNAKREAPGKLLWYEPHTMVSLEALDDSLPLLKDERRTQVETYSVATAADATRVLEEHWTQWPFPIRRGIQPPPEAVRHLDRSVKLLELCRFMADYGNTPEEIYAVVKQTPWNKFRGRPDEDQRLQETVRRALSLVETPLVVERHDGEGKVVRTEYIPGNPFRFLSRDEIALMKDPEPAVGGLIPRNSLCVVYGPPGGGKTFLTLDIALSMASKGGDFHDQDTINGPVAYITGEGAAGFKSRIEAWETHRGLDAERFFLLPEMPHFLGQDAEHATQALAQLPEKPVCIVVDTLARALAGGNENDNADMGRMVGICDKLRTDYTDDGVVILVHHTGKQGTDARGASALRGAADTMMYVTQPKQGYIKVACEKQKEAEPFETHAYQLIQIKESAATLPAADVPQDQIVLPPQPGPSSKQEEGWDFARERIKDVPGPTRQDLLTGLEEGLGVSGATAYRWLADWYQRGLIDIDPEGRVIAGT